VNHFFLTFIKMIVFLWRNVRHQ